MNPLASTKCAGHLLMALTAIASILLMAACGSSSSRPAPNPQGFNDGSLTGNYVISISGTDVNSSSFIVPFAIAGTIAANGKGGITGGTVDINDPGNLGVQIGQAVSSSSGYQVGPDGRGSGTLVVASGATFNFDFVLTSASHGLISRFDSFGTGSGTIDIQTPVTSLTGSYAFSLSGFDFSGGNFNPLGTVGALTLNPNSNVIVPGIEDFNDNGTSGPGYTDLTLTGQVVLAAGGTSGTAHLTTPVANSNLASLNFDVWVIDSTHLKFIETDTADTGVLLAGDAFTQVTSIAAGQLVFVLSGIDGLGNPVAAGGYATTDANGDLTNGFEDYNDNGTVAFSKPFFTTAAGCVAGRCQLTLNGFTNGLESVTGFVVYPSSGGGQALEIGGLGLLQGASYSQSATSFTGSGGYALNLTGQNTGPGGEVDDIAQFDAGAPATSFTGPFNMTGSLDENDLGSLLRTSGLKGYYVPDTAPDGRGSISSTNSNTFLGGFTLQYYVVDSSTVVFIDVDSLAQFGGEAYQVAVGIFQAQGASGSAAAQSRMAIVHPAVRAHGALRRK
jgi:hypothetical protein